MTLFLFLAGDNKSNLNEIITLLLEKNLVRDVTEECKIGGKQLEKCVPVERSNKDVSESKRSLNIFI